MNEEDPLPFESAGVLLELLDQSVHGLPRVHRVRHDPCGPRHLRDKVWGKNTAQRCNEQYGLRSIHVVKCMMCAYTLRGVGLHPKTGIEQTIFIVSFYWRN